MALPPPNPEFPDVPLTGVTELRTHGVSGTPVESMLHHPHPIRVAGAGAAGFYRRGEDHEPPFDHVPAGRNLEAYSWGGLTSGSGSRAFWLLLAPFMLANVASWVHPVRPRKQFWPIGVLSGLVRLFAVTLTVTFMLATATVGIDLIGWQCVDDPAGCGKKHFFTNPLVQHLATRPGARVALGALLPVAVLGVLWFLSKSTGGAYEDFAGAKTDAASADASGAADLANPNFWRGGAPFQRLRSLHVCTALATVAGIVGYGARQSVALAWTAGLLAGLCGVVLVSPLAGRRKTLLRGEDPPKPLCVAMANAQWAGVALLAYTLWYAATTPPMKPGDPPLPVTVPGLDRVVHGVFAGQLVVLALLFAAAAIAKVMSPTTDAETLVGHMLFRSFGAPLLAVLSIGFAGMYASGLVLRFADYLGNACRSSADCTARDLHVTSTYYVAAPAAIATVAAGLLIAAVVKWWWLPRRRRCCTTTVLDEYGQTAASPRVAAIAKWQASASLTDHADLFVMWFLALTVAGTAVLVRLAQHATWLTTAGSWLVGLLAGAVIALGRSAYGSDGTRRTVGILWDLGTFWPRAAHPFAPPCYCERVVPEFTARVDRLTKAGGTVVVSAHSQGTVIAAAAIHRLDPAACRNVGLVTYGSPLERLYARLFPHFFGVTQLRTAEHKLGGCWRNLYRRTDPIGGPVFTLDTAAWTCGKTPTPDTNPVDVRFVDPEFALPPGEVTELSPRGHSDYFHDSRFAAAVTEVATCVPAKP